MARVALLFILIICMVIVLSGVEGKKNGKSKQAKAKKIEGLFTSILCFLFVYYPSSVHFLLFVRTWGSHAISLLMLLSL